MNYTEKMSEVGYVPFVKTINIRGFCCFKPRGNYWPAVEIYLCRILMNGMK